MSNSSANLLNPYLYDKMLYNGAGYLAITKCQIVHYRVRRKLCRLSSSEPVSGGPEFKPPYFLLFGGNDFPDFETPIRPK